MTSECIMVKRSEVRKIVEGKKSSAVLCVELVIFLQMHMPQCTGLWCLFTSRKRVDILKVERGVHQFKSFYLCFFCKKGIIEKHDGSCGKCNLCKMMQVLQVEN